MADKADELIHAIEPPSSLSDRQITLARKYVKESMLEGFTVQKFCSENSVSTKSWYSWIEDADFKYYLHQVQDASIPQDERLAYEQLKKYLLKIPYKQNPSVKEIELFRDYFSYLVEADKRQKAEALGLNETTSKASSGKSLEERKAILIGRLMGGTNTKKEKNADV